MKSWPATGTKPPVSSGLSKKVAWPSGLRRWFKAPVSSEAWVRIPPLPGLFFSLTFFYNVVLTSMLENKVRAAGAVAKW